jgi:hypothetical protein
MNKKYRFKLQKGNKKERCPDCGDKSFKYYVDTYTNELLPENYGRCDRESKCEYHLSPYHDGYADAIWQKEKGDYSALKKLNKNPTIHKPIIKESKTIFFDKKIFLNTLNDYDKNIFIQNLCYNVPFTFDAQDIEKVIEHYYLGTISQGFREGAITFPFIDNFDNVRAVQVKLFDKNNKTTDTGFLHGMLIKQYSNKRQAVPKWLLDYNNQESKVTCLFGEHLLKLYPANPIALVEAPKTAIYGTLYFGLPKSPHDFLWLAVYNKSSFTLDKLKVLKERFIYVFPDLSNNGKTYEEWQNKAKLFQKEIYASKFIFYDFLEKFAPSEDKTNGLDIADYLIKLDWRDFRTNSSIITNAPTDEIVTETEQQIGSYYQPVEEIKNMIKNQEVIESEMPKSEPSEDNDEIKNILFLDNKEHQPKEYIYLDKTEKVNWNKQILALETFFANKTLPSEPVNLNNATTIQNGQLFVKTHLATVKANNGNKTFLPYLERLINYKKMIEMK